MIDEAFLPDDSSNDDVLYRNYAFLTHKEWKSLFKDNGLTLLEEQIGSADANFDNDKKAIASRASELIARHPEKRALFEGYVQSQLDEYEDLETNVTAVTWMLQVFGA